MSKYYIYGLYDPFTNELRYIGKTKMTLAKRLWHHIKEARSSSKNTYKLNWIRKITSKEKKPIISVIKETTKENWQKDEKECIAFAIESGVKLTNLTAGGDGLVDFNHSEETKRKISEYNLANGKTPPNQKGRKQSPEHIRKRIEARRKKGNYEHSEKTKNKISKGRTGKALGNQNTLGYRHTEQWKKEQSKRMLGKSNPFFGKQHTEETKQKISKAKKSRGDKCL